MSAEAGRIKKLCAFLRRQNLTAAIHTGLQIDMVRTAQFAGVLVFNVGSSLERVSRAAHTALGRACFSLRYSHFNYSTSQANTSNGQNGGRNDVSRFRKFCALIHASAGLDQSPALFFEIQ